MWPFAMRRSCDEHVGRGKCSGRGKGECRGEKGEWLRGLVWAFCLGCGFGRKSFFTTLRCNFDLWPMLTFARPPDLTHPPPPPLYASVTYCLVYCLECLEYTRKVSPFSYPGNLSLSVSLSARPWTSASACASERERKTARKCEKSARKFSVQKFSRETSAAAAAVAVAVVFLSIFFFFFVGFQVQDDADADRLSWQRAAGDA